MKTKRSPWVVAIVVAFIVMALVNAGFIYIAVRGADQVVPSYLAEDR